YQEYTDAAYPEKDYIGPLYVVNQATFSDPSATNATYYQTYGYYGAWMNLTGRGFDGFDEISTYDSRTSAFGTFHENKYFERQFPYRGMLYKDVLSAGTFNARALSVVPGLLTLDATPNNERYFPYSASAQRQIREVGG